MTRIMKQKEKKEQEELRELISAYPSFFGGNVKLMTGNTIFNIELELNKLRKKTKHCKKIKNPKVREC